MIYFLILIMLGIALLIVVHLLQEIEKKLDIESEFKCRQILNKMMDFYNCNLKFDYEFKTFPAYSVIKNKIYMPDNEKKSIKYNISAAHELGHFIIANRSEVFRFIIKKSQYLIGINRIFVIPILVCVVLVNCIISVNIENLITILYCIFLIVSFLRITIGIGYEIGASYYAYKFFKNNELHICYNKMILKYYKYCIVQQFLGTLCTCSIIIFLKHFIS